MVAPAADDVQMAAIELVGFFDGGFDIGVVLRADGVFDGHHIFWIGGAVGEDVEHTKLVGSESSAKGFDTRECGVELVFVCGGWVEAHEERAAALKKLIPLVQ